MAGVKKVLTPSRRKVCRTLPLDGGGEHFPSELAQIGIEVFEHGPKDHHGYAEFNRSGGEPPCRPNASGVIVASNE